MRVGKSELIRRLSDRIRKPLTDNDIRLLIESLWRDWNDYLFRSAIEDTKGITGFVHPSDIDVSYDHATRKVTLTGNLDYYWRGRKQTLTSPWTSPAHDATLTKWFIYMNDGENFAWSTPPWSFSDAMVSMVNYKATAAETFAICETHGTMDSEAHEEDHDINGTYLLSGGKATAGTFTLNTATDAANSPGFDQAVIKDEDKRTTIAAWIEGTYTTMRVGVSGEAVFDIAATLPFISAGSYLQVNDPYTGAMTDGINNRFYNVYQVLIPVTSDAPSQKYRMVFLQPQKTFIDQTTAESEDVNGLLLGDLNDLTAEFKIYSRLTYKTLAGDANTGKCRLASITYVVGTRSNSLNVGGIVPSNHAALSNLPWTTAGHTGTAGKLAGFGESGEAVEVDKHNPVTIAEESAALASIDENQVLTIEPQAGVTTYLELTDTSDTTYTDKDMFVPVVNEATGELDLTETEELTGATGTFTTADSKTVTVTNGIIVSIV